MNLIIHQFRKDVRQFRWLLVVWFVMLGSDLAVNLGWIGSGIGQNWQQGDTSVATVMAGVQVFFLWVLFFLLPSSVVLADSPSRRDGFLRTRPLPPLDLYLAKALFVVVLVIVPAVLQEGVYLTASGLPGHYVLHGVLERLLYALPMVMIAAGFASLWRSYARWSGGLGITGSVMIGGMILLQLISMLTGREDVLPKASPVPLESRALGALYLLSLAVLLLGVVHARRVWQARGRWAGIATVLASYYVAVIYWPWDLFPNQGADPAAARAVAAQFPPKLSAGDIQLNQVYSDKGDSHADYGLAIKSGDVPAGPEEVVEWHPGNSRLLNASGGALRPDDQPGFAPAYNPLPWNDNLPSRADLKTWIQRLPGGVIFSLGQDYFPGDTSFSLGTFKLDPGAAWLKNPVTIEAQLDGRVCRWDKVADFTLSTPGVIKDAEGSWAFEGVHQERGALQFDVFLKRNQVSFATATDPRTKSFEWSPNERYSFVFYNARRNIATEGNRWGGVITTRARSTALSQYWMNLDQIQPMGFGNSFSRSELGDLHLLIFEKVWLGTVPVPWKCPAFVINDLAAPIWTGPGGGEHGLSPGELDRRVAALPLPEAKASRLEVCHYLVQALSILDTSRYNHAAPVSVVNRLAILVPDHLEVLLDGLPAMGPVSKGAVIQAIIRGAEESQKGQIIGALLKVPDLMTVILHRDWVADAHEAIYQLVASPQPLSHEAIQAIASFHDAGTYPRLLAALKADPNPETYDILRGLPGMAGALDDCVREIWGDQDGIVDNNGGNFVRPVLGLALHTGNPDALRFACRLLAETGSSQAGNLDWALAQVFRDNIKVEKLSFSDAEDNRKLLKWMKGYTADAFAFDPVRRRFVLKPGAVAHR